MKHTNLKEIEQGVRDMIAESNLDHKKVLEVTFAIQKIFIENNITTFEGFIIVELLKQYMVEGRG